MEEDVFEYKRAEWLSQTGPIIHYNKLKRVINNQETDQQFIQDICRIHELQKLQKKSIWQEKTYQYSQQQQEEIHMKARLHADANKFNATSNTEFAELAEENRCDCGCMRGKGEDISMLSNEENLTFLGPGVVLFFLYQKRIVYMIILTALIYGIFSLLTNYSQNLYDSSSVCDKEDGAILFSYCEFRSAFSVQNKSMNSWSFYLQIWLGLLVSILWIFGLRMIRVLGYKKNQAIDQMLDSSSDYCISLENLPFKNFNQKEVQNFLVGLWQSQQIKKKRRQDLNIKSIQIIYNMSQVREMISELQSQISVIRTFLVSYEQMVEKMKNDRLDTEQNLIEDNSSHINRIEVKRTQIMNIMVRRSHKKRRRSNQKNLIPPRIFKTSQEPKLPPIQEKTDNRIHRQKINDYLKSKQKIISLYEKLRSYRWNFLKNSEFRKNLATESCLVEFIDSNQQSVFLEEFGSQRIPPLRAIKEELMALIFPNQNNGLMFKNNIVKIKRAPEPSDIEWLNCEKKDSFSKNLKVWTITLFIVFISFWMLMLIRVVRMEWEPLNNITIITAISLQVFNRLIWITVVKIVTIEEKNTKTDSIISIMSKAIFAQAVNVIFLPLLMNTYMYDRYSGPNGLVGMVVDYQITVCFMMTVWNLLDIPYMIHKLSLHFRCLRVRIIRMLSQSITGNLSDYEEIRKVLTYYQPPEFPIAGGYVYVTTVLNQAFFFCHLQPLLLLLLVFNMTVFFVINKYLLYKRCKIPALTDIMVFQTCVALTKNIPIMYGMGSMYFILLAGGSFKQCIPSILSLIFAALVMLNPNKIFSKLTTYLVENMFQPDQQSESEAQVQASEVRPFSPDERIKQIQQRGQHSGKQVKGDQPQKDENGNNKEILFEESSGCQLNNKGMLLQNLEQVNETNSNSDQSHCLSKQSKIQSQVRNEKSLLQLPRNPLEVLEESNLEDQQSVCQSVNANKSPKLGNQLDKGIYGVNILDISNIEKNSEPNNSTLNDNSLIRKIMKKSFKDQEQSTRKQCYCQNSNINQLFYFEKFFVAQSSVLSGNRSKKFCESFSFRGNSKRISLFQLLPLGINDEIKPNSDSNKKSASKESNQKSPKEEV